MLDRALYTVNGRRERGIGASPSTHRPAPIPTSAATDLGRTEALTLHVAVQRRRNRATGRRRRTLATYGSYTATLTVVRRLRPAEQPFTNITVSEVAPIVSALPDAHLIAGETYSAAGQLQRPRPAKPGRRP